jgi:hypothetical protein
VPDPDDDGLPLRPLRTLLSGLRDLLREARRRLCREYGWTLAEADGFPLDDVYDELRWLSRAEYERTLLAVQLQEAAIGRALARAFGKGRLPALKTWEQLQEEERRRAAEGTAWVSPEWWTRPPDPLGGSRPADANGRPPAGAPPEPTS